MNKDNFDEWERQEDIDKGVKAMDDLSDLFNSGNYTAQKAFIKKFQSEHRTLQQNMLRAMFTIMVDCREQANTRNYDGRNEDGVKACKIMVDAYEKERGFLPMNLSHI